MLDGTPNTLSRYNHIHFSTETDLTNLLMQVRVVCERAYHALFMNNMLIRPTRKQLATFGEPDYVIYNAGMFLLSYPLHIY